MREVATAGGFKYCVVVFKCGSHLANLVVGIAICGAIVARPLESDSLCANCSRRFKHLLPDVQEFGLSLQKYIVQELRVVDAAEAELVPEKQAITTNLRCLYGQNVLPESVSELYNRDIGVLEHVAAGPVDRRSLCGGRFFCLLYHLIFRIEERPVITRLVIRVMREHAAVGPPFAFTD